MSETWCKTLEILKARVEPEPFERWFAPLEVIKADGAASCWALQTSFQSNGLRTTT